MADTSSKPGSFRGTMMVVFFTLLIDLLGFTVILPLLPSMLEYYGTHDEVKVLKILVEARGVTFQYSATTCSSSKVARVH